MADLTTEQGILEIVSQKNNAKTVIDFGADPTGKTDSSAAFQAAADAVDSTIRVPSWGRYRIDKQVSLRKGNASRKLLIGQSFNHFGNGGERASLFPGPNLEGAMFDGAYIVERIAFRAEGNQKAIAFELDAYANQVIGCSFNGFKRAISTYGGVNQTYARNQFTGCTDGIYQWGGVATVSQFKENLFQYVDNCIVFENEAHGMSFMGNTFERVKGYPIRAKSLLDAAIINNWFEHTNGGGEDVSPVTTSASQQIQSAYTAGNHCQSGFRNIFSDATHSGRVGGVITDKGNLIVRDPTGSATRLKQTGLYQEIDDWAGLRQFIFKAGRAKAAQKSADFLFQTGHKGSHYFEAYDNDGNAQPFSGTFNYRMDADRYHIEKLSSYFGMDGETQKDGYSILTSTPAMMKWSSTEGHRRNMALFSEAKFEDGTLTLKLKELVRNPVFIPVAQGAQIELIEMIEPYQRPTWEHCKGWKITFKDKQMPSEVHMSLTCYENT
ncbi:right-handed parallel beta-helix repeat-containing protein [Phytohalomonas tamaricis]|uniref:right-handed parallel beta-helix repeat-containing protein n=1 Tax=Phytohalomonas tamaricis TaxID=2081032 RepID=UPI000D0B1334|nr:right-handed parallel beta-helix repeat-containing protein [Phytohalomonas tamaricis]